MHVVVGKRTAVRVHGALAEDDAIRNAAVRAFGRILLRHAPVYVHGGIAHLEQPAILRVGVLVCVDHRMGVWALGEEIRHILFSSALMNP